MTDIGKITPCCDGWGVISNLYDADGEDVTDIYEAVSGVARVLTGPSAGLWASFEISDAIELAQEIYYTC